MTIEAVLAGRRAEREALLDLARAHVGRLDPDLGMRAAVVFGSVARGDFNLWSDVDLLVVAERLPPDALRRLEALGAPPPRVQPLGWTPEEWRRRLAGADPIASEAVSAGVWMAGSAEALAQG